MKPRLFDKSDICVIGGRGRMGRWLVNRFCEAGMSPSIFDQDDFPISEKILESFDVIALTVPISAVENVMASVGRYLRPDAVVIDISSVKKKPIELMLNYCQSEVIGSHPLFGPSAPSFDGQTVFLCPVRSNHWKGLLKDFLDRRGANIIEIDADEHDRLMACVQTLRHILLTSLGKTLIELGLDPDSNRVVTGQWFGAIVEMLKHQLHQPPELYAELAVENYFAADTLRIFHENFFELATLVSNRDRSGISNLMDEVAQSFSSKDELSKDGSLGWWRELGGDSRHPDV